MKKILIINPEKNLIKHFVEVPSSSIDTAQADDFAFVLEHGKVINLFYKGKPLPDYHLFFIRLWERNRFLNGPIYAALKTYGANIEADISCAHHHDKLIQNISFHEQGIRIPKTVYIPTCKITEYIDILENHLSYPLIQKSSDGAKGQDNYKVSSREEIIKICHDNPSIEFIYQEYIPNSFDYRFVVLGYKTRLVYKRQRANQDTHLNNLTQGGSVEKVPLDSVQELCIIAEQASKSLERTVCGIDLMPGDDGYTYILEANNGPGLKSFDGYDHLLSYLEDRAEDTL